MADMLTSVHEHDLSGPDAAAKADRRVRPVAHGARINLLPAVRNQIIPRLHAALQGSLSLPRVIPVTAPLGGEVQALSDRLLAGDERGVREQFDGLREAGHSLESLYLELLAPTGCHLRDLWKDDHCNLAEVTLALCSLQGILRHYAEDFHAECSRRGAGLRALLVSPSRTSSDLGLPLFGLVLMSEFFRREGWDTWIEHDLKSPDFHGTVLAEWFDLVEILATDDNQLDAISAGIRRIRRGSPNPSVGIIVCGQIFLDRPDFARLVGADHVATDPLSSLSQAEQLVSKSSTPRERLS